MWAERQQLSRGVSLLPAVGEDGGSLQACVGAGGAWAGPPGRGHAAQAGAAGAGRSVEVGGPSWPIVLTPTQVSPEVGTSCPWPLAPRGLVLRLGSHPGEGQRGQPGSVLGGDPWPQYRSEPQFLHLPDGRTLHQPSPPKRWGGPRRPWRAGPRDVLSPESDYATAVDRQTGATKATLATAPEHPGEAPPCLPRAVRNRGVLR